MPTRLMLACCAALSIGSYPVSALAETESSTTASEEPQSLDLWEKISDSLRGSLTLGAYHHFEAAPQEATNTRYQANLKLEWSGSLNERTRYFFTPQLYLDNLGWSSGVVDEEPELNPDRFRVDLEEYYLRYNANRFDLTLGRQLFNWGIADGYNPNNNINPMDLLDVPTLKKMGVFSGSLRYSDEDLSAHLVVIPWFTPTRIPSFRSRWQGDFGEAASQFSGLELVSGGRELPDHRFEDAAYAVRLSSSTLLRGWDLAVSFYEGFDPIGVLRGEQRGSQIALSQVFPRFQESGLSFSTTWSSLEFHGEAGLHDTQDNRMDDDYLEYILGLNWTYYDLPFTEESFLILEYADERITRNQSAYTPFSGSGEYVRPFKGSWIASVRLSFNQETQLTLSGLRNPSSQDGVWRAKLSHQFSDSLKLDLGGEWIYGSPDTFFGHWSHNDRIWANLILFL